MNGFIQQALQGLDEEQARQILNSLDDEQIEQGVQWVIEESVVPHLNEIRQRAHEAPPTEEVRRDLESLPSEDREQLFYDTLDDLVATLVLCRERPKEGFVELKKLIRDPYTVEALLLIFENDQHIDIEYTDQLKDFGIEHLHWVGVMVLPEMYGDEEIESVMQQVDMQPDPTEEGPGG